MVERMWEMTTRSMRLKNAEKQERNFDRIDPSATLISRIHLWITGLLCFPTDDEFKDMK